jgi:hypothetical protein
MSTANGIGLHIGLNAVDARQYEGWAGTLVACEADAKDMHAITSARGFASSMLLTRKATAAAVTAGVRRAARKLDAGDLFVLSYSGHGGQVRDPSGEEADWEDETWVLWDRQLLDDELYALWGAFKPGVRILVLSDSCHSGTVVRDMFYRASPANAATSDRFKFMPSDVQDRTYEAHRAEYDGLQQTFAQGDKSAVGASLVLISGCQDSQYSRDGDRNGLFTQRLREVWADGAFAKGHRAFYRAICELMPPDQTPNYIRVGRPSSGFERTVPFTI